MINTNSHKCFVEKLSSKDLHKSLMHVVVKSLYRSKCIIHYQFLRNIKRSIWVHYVYSIPFVYSVRQFYTYHLHICCIMHKNLEPNINALFFMTNIRFKVSAKPFNHIYSGFQTCIYRYRSYIALSSYGIEQLYIPPCILHLTHVLVMTHLK